MNVHPIQTDDTPAGWRKAAPQTRLFQQMIHERKMALSAALDILRDVCMELESPDANEFCFCEPWRPSGWQDYCDTVEFETNRLCRATAFLVDAGLAEMRHYEGREGNVLTVMPWNVFASVKKTMERCAAQQTQGGAA